MKALIITTALSLAVLLPQNVPSAAAGAAPAEASCCADAVQGVQQTCCCAREGAPEEQGCPEDGGACGGAMRCHCPPGTCLAPLALSATLARNGHSFPKNEPDRLPVTLSDESLDSLAVQPPTPPPRA